MCTHCLLQALTTCAMVPVQEKNVSADMLEGKVGRIYMPKQDVGGMALHKMKARTTLFFHVACPSVLSTRQSAEGAPLIKHL